MSPPLKDNRKSGMKLGACLFSSVSLLWDLQRFLCRTPKGPTPSPFHKTMVGQENAGALPLCPHPPLQILSGLFCPFAALIVNSHLLFPSVMFHGINEDLLLVDRLAAARQTAQILYAEVQKTNNLIQDSTLQQASTLVAAIPPRGYMRQFNTLSGHRDKIAGIKWASDSIKLLSACQDGFMIIWDSVTGMKLQAIELENSWVLLCAYSPSGRFVALAGLDNRCTVYKVNIDPPESTPPGSIELSDRPRLGRKIARPHAAYVSSCEFVADSQVLTALGDMTIALWDMAKDAKTRDFLDHTSDVLLLLVVPNLLMLTQTFLSSGADGYVKVWDVRAKNAQKSCQVSKTDVNSVTQLPDGYSFVTGSDDGFCKLYDLRSDCELATYSLLNHYEPRSAVTESPTSRNSMWSRFHTPGVVSVELSHSGRILYACYADYGCVAWDTLKNDIVEVLGVGNGSHTGRISQVSVSPDGQGLATASWDSTIKVWST